MVIQNHSHLPEELLIYEIFRLLPVESLLACNCVCKRWNSIISNPKFASFHLQQSPFSDHRSLLINTKTCFLSFNSEDHRSFKVAKISETDASIVASCNGLICLDDEAHNSLYIWNPTTLKKIQIPYPQSLIKTAVVWGFGHVSSTDDYKIVRITDHRNMKQVQVFSFTNKAWKNLDIEIENCSLGKIPPLTETGVSINNWIYWAVYYTEYDIGFYDQCFHIMGLNLINEKFTPIEPLPEWPDHGFYGPPGLLRLLDERYRGIAHGVGQTEILGRIHVAPIKIGNVFYPCSFTVLDSDNMEFLFGLDMLRKHQCIIDLKEGVLRVGGGEVSVPFLPEKDIPSRFLDEERFTKQASGSGVAVSSGSKDGEHVPARSQSSGGAGGNPIEGSDFEAKVAKLVELGFERNAVIQALQLFNGNEEQAAGFLFG